MFEYNNDKDVHKCPICGSIPELIIKQGYGYIPIRVTNEPLFTYPIATYQYRCPNCWRMADVSLSKERVHSDWNNDIVPYDGKRGKICITGYDTGKGYSIKKGE